MEPYHIEQYHMATNQIEPYRIETYHIQGVARKMSPFSSTSGAASPDRATL